MEDERLARAIARIEQAVAKLAEIGPLAAPPGTPADDTARKAEFESLEKAHQDALDDRERTIAKLRADIADISALKDQEIARLQKELQAAPNTGVLTVPEAEHHALQQKYDQLRSTAESTLNGLDGIIGKVERAKNG
ncbi:hypothetical protein [Parasphingopyxis lamellibrachiae]|uniref:Uncharacterized protein n=1 Tax=Parasphingopyxis lamellibrachiae TaxID=680125 RepID=A0A3D9FC11_9SPHN|nr:hypothetical protein [Parasphingopyxis lamellibrachiae]RED15350.1 hypothetical protein DFR46_0341 [Parasphingopyxis lamellibrachiae]